MLQRHTRQLVAVAVAVGAFTAFAVAPVAASGGIDLGGDDGVTAGTDGIGLGGDDGISVGLDPGDGVNASAGGDDGVEVSASPDDGVGAEVAGEEVPPGAGDAGGPEGVGDVADAGSVDDVGVADGDLEAVGSQVDALADGDAGVDSLDGSPGDATGGLGDADVPTEPTDVHLDADDVPEQARLLRQILQAAPETDAVGPEDAPVTGEDAPVDVCEQLEVGTEDLPVGALPGLGELPDVAQPPGVPSTLITPEAVTGIVLGAVPGPCEVVDPTDPQVDPTNLPEEPAGELNLVRLGLKDGGPDGVVVWQGTLNESGDGPGVDGMLYVTDNREFGDNGLDLAVNDGRHDYGAYPRVRYHEDGYEGEAVLVLLGKEAGVEGHCERLQDYDGDLLTLDFDELEENPLGPCEYELVGLPHLYGPGDVFGTINDQANRDELPVDPGGLPVNPDALLNV
jgi:hypothetical protein